MERKLRVGIIGTGAIAQLGHIQGYQKIKEVELAGISDVNLEKAKEIAGKNNIPEYFKRHRDLLSLDLDIVSVCTPNYLHLPQVTDAFRAGKHVICEKPLALNYAQAKKIVSASKKYHKKLMPAMCLRFNSEAQFLKNLIDKGEFGEIYYIKAYWIRRRGAPGLGGWFTNKRLSGGGPLIDLGVHIIDLAMWFGGSPRALSVTGSTFTKFGASSGEGGWPPEKTKIAEKAPKKVVFNVEDLVSGFIRLSSGAVIFFETSWVSHARNTLGITIMGTKGGAEFCPFGEPLKIYKEVNGVQTDLAPDIAKNDGFEEELRHFAYCVRNDKEPLVTKSETLQVMKIIDAVYESSKTKKEIKL